MTTRKNRVSVTDNRAIIVDIDGVKHKLTLAEAQQLHDALSALVGIRRPWVYPYNPYTWTYGAGTMPVSGNASGNVITLNTASATEPPTEESA